MFPPLQKALENWFDNVSDGWNPVTVRDLRRLRRSLFFTIATIAHLGLLIFIHVADLTPLDFSEEIIMRVFPTYAAMLIVVLMVVGSEVRARLTDELLDAVPLTQKDKVHGILGTSCLLSAFFLVQALPFLAFPAAVPYSVLIRLGILLGMFIATQMLTLYVLPFFIRTKTVAESVIVVFVVMYLDVGALGLPFIIVWDDILRLPLLPDAVYTSWSLIVAMSIGGILALSSFTSMNYRLSLYHFGNPFESCWQTVFVNFLCHAAWSSCWAVIAFFVAFCFSL